MTVARFIHDGGSVDYTPGSDVAAGDVVVQGELVGISARPIAAGELGALAVVGVFDLPKATGADTGIPAGAKVYWDVADGVAKEDDESGANKLLGKTVADAADADAAVAVRLSP